MEFTKFVTRLQEHFVEMTKNINILYEVEVDKDELWNLYLDSYIPFGNLILKVQHSSR